MAILLTLLISAVYSAFVTFMCMTLQGISGTVVTFIAIYVINLSLSIVLMFFMDKEWAQYMFDIFPTFQFQQITVVGDDPKHLAMFPVYSCSLIVSFTVCGLYIFRKANVK